MDLSSELISEFVKATKPETPKKETIVYGTIVMYNGTKYVKLDGSPDGVYTPISTTAGIKENDRVTVVTKDHTAIVTGNLSSPSARTEDVEDIADQVSNFEIVLADKVSTKELDAQKGRIDNLVADNVLIREELTAAEADISKLEADNVTINEKLTANEAEVKRLDAEKIGASTVEADYAKLGRVEALEGDFYSLESTYGEFEKLVTADIKAQNGKIDNLETEMFDAETGSIKFAMIDFANIGEAALTRLFSDTGLIESLVVNNQSITGRLVGVTIKGDIIEGGTIIADKLVVLGDDGLYYKLNTNGVTTEAEQTDYNSLNGSIITAKSITAEKVNVNDLVAFGATIGGFNINNNAIYSGVKSSVDNSTRGTYLSADGQISIGDETRFIKYYHVSMASAYVSNNALVVRETSPGSVSTNISDGVAHFTDASQSMDIDASLINDSFSLKVGTYELEISAESILFAGGSRKSLGDLKKLTEHVKIQPRIDPDTGDLKPCIELSEGDSDFKQAITNKASRIMDGENVVTEMDTDGVTTENVTVRNEIRQGQWAWLQHGRGNLGLMWKGVVN